MSSANLIRVTWRSLIAMAKNINGKALMFVHAISGCDTVSSFLGRGKKSAWLAWSYFPSVTDAFLDLSLKPVDVSSETL